MKDQIGSMEIVLLFSSVIDEVSNNTCYDFKKMRIHKFINVHVLKQMETITVSENEIVKISLSND